MDEPRREAAWRALAGLGSAQGCATLLRTLGDLPPP